MAINGYDVKSEIHRGPLTTVYEAYHLALGRRVILKVLNSQWTEEKDLIDRFRREAKICARLDHPNIVKIFDFSASKDPIFISMEYIEGSTLEMSIQQKKIIDFSEIISITSQILTGLSYAHKRGIIHRDIKPSNIMISSDRQVKITDFGLAMVSDLPGITGQEQTVGSPAYMSPEQAMGAELDHRTDLFSLGVSLYKMCAQKPPFETDNIGTTIHNILTKDVESLSSVNPAIPVWFSDLVDTLLAKNHENRPDSSEKVLGIINSKYSIDEIELKNDHLKDLQPVNIRSSKSTLLHYFSSKVQIRIFLWVFPIIIILVYLIFRQFDNGMPEQTAEQNNLAQMQNIIIPDTHIVKHPENRLQNNNFTNKSNNREINSSPVLVNRISKNNEPIADTDSPERRGEQSHLFIIARPWADIFIDSLHYETTPLTKSISIEAGSHFIELKNPNYQIFSKQYFFNPAQSETLIVDLKINVGFLNIRVLPWAKIYIDGEYKETSPIDNPITVAAGEHIVTLTNPNHTSIKDTIEVFSGKTLEKNFTFAK